MTRNFELITLRPHKKKKLSDPIFRAYQKELRKKYTEKRKREIELRRKPYVDFVLSLSESQRTFLCKINHCIKQNLVNELMNLDELLKNLEQSHD